MACLFGWALGGFGRWFAQLGALGRFMTTRAAWLLAAESRRKPKKKAAATQARHRTLPLSLSHAMAWSRLPPDCQHAVVSWLDAPTWKRLAQVDRATAQQLARWPLPFVVVVERGQHHRMTAGTRARVTRLTLFHDELGLLSEFTAVQQLGVWASIPSPDASYLPIERVPIPATLRHLQLHLWSPRHYDYLIPLVARCPGLRSLTLEFLSWCRTLDQLELPPTLQELRLVSYGRSPLVVSGSLQARLDRLPHLTLVNCTIGNNPLTE